MITIADVFKRDFVVKIRVNDRIVRGVVTDKNFDKDKGSWKVEISTTFDGKSYSKWFYVDEIITAFEDNAALKIS